MDLQPLRPDRCLVQVIRVSLLDQELFIFEQPFQFLQGQDPFVKHSFEFPGYLLSDSLLLRIQCGFIVQSSQQIGEYCSVKLKMLKLVNSYQIQMSSGVSTSLLFVIQRAQDALLRVIRIIPLFHDFEMKVLSYGQFVNYMDYLGVELQTPTTRIIYKWGCYNLLIEDCTELIVKLVFAPFGRRLYESVSFYNILLQIEPSANSIIQMHINMPYAYNYFIYDLEQLMLNHEESESLPEIQNQIDVFFFNQYIQQRMEQIEHGTSTPLGFNYAKFSTERISAQELSRFVNARLGAQDKHVRSPAFPHGVAILGVQSSVMVPSRRVFKTLQQAEEFGVAQLSNVLSVVLCTNHGIADFALLVGNGEDADSKQNLSAIITHYNLQVLDIPKDSSKLSDASMISCQPVYYRYKTVKIKNKKIDFQLCLLNPALSIDTLRTTVISRVFYRYKGDLSSDFLATCLFIRTVKTQLLVIDEMPLSFGSTDAFLADALFKTASCAKMTCNGETITCFIKWRNQKLREFHAYLRKWQQAAKGPKK